MFWLGISKALAGPMDLHIFVVLDEMRFLGFLYVGARIRSLQTCMVWSLLILRPKQ